MDEIVSYFDGNILEPHLPQFVTALFPEGTLMRQIFCLEIILIFGAFVLYFISSSFTYWLFFKFLKEKYHPDSDPQPYPGQIRDGIALSCWAMPLMGQLFCPFFLGHIRGHAKLYDKLSEYGCMYFCLSVIMLLIWSDTLIYWIHREEHDVKYLYKNFHKLHHKFKVVTPYACFAFHPIDGFVQAFPYLLFPYFFPMHKWFYLTSFIFLQLWTVSIHDGVHLSPFWCINGSAHHYLHHTKFNYNYGQYLTFWDRLCNTHMDPNIKYYNKHKQWVKKEK